ncbi:ComF family protein [Neisseria lisongii]|uniref:ComF family protein n=1 Tax=Neisseria lisongii TaxID=2912188 RepID=A0AAW5AND0_9NEIS|nr:ComF family protein [Neisseria lisongii]MCF7528953.1 ComF family protein [Neisseria lisongii]
MAVLSFLQKLRRQHCLLCHDLCRRSDSDGLCSGCRADLASGLCDGDNSCPLCFRPIAGGAVCGSCQQKPPHFDRLWASLYYEPPISSIIHLFKHLSDLSPVRPLVSLMAQHPPPWLAQERIDGVLPVPLSKNRRLYRGFNQSEELAERLAALYGWRILPHDTVLRADKPPQSTLKSSERRRNVRNIFQCRMQFPPDCNILLIDDVMTTGATLDELAKTLKKSGAAEVFCWTLARSRLKK